MALSDGPERVPAWTLRLSCRVNLALRRSPASGGHSDARCISNHSQIHTGNPGILRICPKKRERVHGRVAPGCVSRAEQGLRGRAWSSGRHQLIEKQASSTEARRVEDRKAPRVQIAADATAITDFHVSGELVWPVLRADTGRARRRHVSSGGRIFAPASPATRRSWPGIAGPFEGHVAANSQSLSTYDEHPRECAIQPDSIARKRV